jgi:hypothetical protein
LGGGKKFKTRTPADLIGLHGQIESEPLQIYKMNLKKQENNSAHLEKLEASQRYDSLLVGKLGVVSRYRLMQQGTASQRLLND